MSISTDTRLDITRVFPRYRSRSVGSDLLGAWEGGEGEGGGDFNITWACYSGLYSEVVRGTCERGGRVCVAAAA